MMKVVLCFALCVCMAYGLPKFESRQAEPASASSEESVSSGSGSSEETGSFLVPQVLPVEENLVQILPFIEAAIQQHGDFSAQVLPFNPDDQDPQEAIVSILPFDPSEGTLGADAALMADYQAARSLSSLSSIISGAPNGTASLSFTNIFSLLSALG